MLETSFWSHQKTISERKYPIVNAHLQSLEIHRRLNFKNNFPQPPICAKFGNDLPSTQTLNMPDPPPRGTTQRRGVTP